MTLGSTDDEGRDMLVEKLAQGQRPPRPVCRPELQRPGPGPVQEAAGLGGGRQGSGLSIYGQSIAMPINPRFKLSEFNLLDDMPNWFIALLGTRKRGSRGFGARRYGTGMKRDIAEWEETDFHKDWSKITVLETVHERNYNTTA